MTKVKVFLYGRQRQQQQQGQQQWCRGYENSSPDFRHSELKIDRVHPIIIGNIFVKLDQMTLNFINTIVFIRPFTWTLTSDIQNQ